MRRAGWLFAMALLTGRVASAGQEAPPSQAAPEATAPVGPAQELAPAPETPAVVPEAPRGFDELEVVASESVPVEAPPSVLTVHEGPLSEPDLPAKTEVTLDRQTHFVGGVGFSGPLGAMGSVAVLHGLGARVRDGDDRVKAVCAVPIAYCAQGFALRLDAGTGGGKFSLGIAARAKVEEEDFKGTVGVGLRASLAHTWGNPLGTEPGVTYLGPELDLSLLKVNLTLGVLWRVAGQGGASALFSWGVGFGL